MFKKRVLIADANSEGVADFRQALGEQWELTSAVTGKAALAEMDKQPADVVVADLDLPEVDGAELLGKIRAKYPKTVLFIVAHEADKERVMKNVLGAHQFLTKPCDKVTLKKAIDRAMALDVWIASNRMRELVARVRSFPTVPSLYLEILAALRSPNATTEQIGAIIAKDMAMMTKLLQVLNSAYFGLSRKITDPVEAVGILGFEAVKSMVMTLKLLSQYDQLKPIYFSIDRLWRHSTEVGRAARQLTLLETGDRALAETAFTAGLMHDLGKVVLAANFDEQYSGAQSLARKQQLVMWEVEKEIFGASHAEIGAYLLGLWGMPLDLLEAAALHHQPLSTITKGFTPLTAVHVANVLVHELNPEREGTVSSKLDEAYLADIGLLDRLPTWRENVAALDSATPETKAKPAESHAPKAAKPAPKPVRSATPKPVPSQPAQVVAPAAASSQPAAGWSFQEKPWLYAGGGAVALGLVALLAVTLLSGPSSKPAPSPSVASTPAARPAAAVAGAPGRTAPDPAKVAPATPGPFPPLVARARTESGTTTTSSVTSPVVKAPATNELRLQGVFFSSGEPSVIINGQLLRVNERYAGNKVISIGRTNVVLENNGLRRTLTLK